MKTIYLACTLAAFTLAACGDKPAPTPPTPKTEAKPAASTAPMPPAAPPAPPASAGQDAKK